MLILFSQLRKWKGLQRRRMRSDDTAPSICSQRTGPASPLADILECTRTGLSKVLRAKRTNLFIRRPIKNLEAIG